MSPIFVVLVAGSPSAQGNFVYTNDDVAGANTVSGFAMAETGALTPVVGSPFLTGGTGVGGELFAFNRVAVCQTGNFVYAANAGSSDVSGFAVDPSTGTLTPVPDSPFPTGGNGGVGISLACTPDGRFLIAANSGSNDITVFNVDSDGGLSRIASAALPEGEFPDGIRVAPNGNFLAVALPISNRVAMFRLASSGALTPVAGSPFPAGGGGRAAGVDVNCASDLLFAGAATAGTTLVTAFSIDATGALTPIPGSPFSPGVGFNSNVVLLSPNDQFLFVSNQDSDSITVFEVASNGASKGSLMLVPGSPFAGPGSLGPAGMATNQGGDLLYSAESNSAISGYRVATDGTLTSVPGTPFATHQPAGLHSLTAFPGKTCDSVPPTTAATASPGPNANGWNNTDVTVTLNATDNPDGSGVKEIHFSLTGAQAGAGFQASSTASVTIATEGVTVLTYFAVDNAGNRETPRTLAIRIDKTPPVVTFQTATPPGNPAGWNNTNVSVPFTVTDSLSGVASPTPSTGTLTLTTEGSAVTGTVTATDLADNSRTYTSPAVKIDKTSPTVTCSAVPAILWPPDHMLVPVSVTVSIADSLSGPGSSKLTDVPTSSEPDNGTGDGDTVNDIQGFTVGAPSATVMLRAERSGLGTGRVYTLRYAGSDAAGNSASCTVRVTVPHDQP